MNQAEQMLEAAKAWLWTQAMVKDRVVSDANVQDFMSGWKAAQKADES